MYVIQPLTSWHIIIIISSRNVSIPYQMVNSGSKPHCYCFILWHLCSTYLNTCTLLGWWDWRGKMRWIHSSGRTDWRTCPGNSLGRSGTPYPVSATDAAASTLEKEGIHKEAINRDDKEIIFYSNISTRISRAQLATHQQRLHICVQWRTQPSQNHSCWELKPAVTVPYQQLYFKSAGLKRWSCLKISIVFILKSIWSFETLKKSASDVSRGLLSPGMVMMVTARKVAVPVIMLKMVRRV